MKADVTVYTDGACSGNPGVGGWGAIIIADGCIQELKGGEAFTTNNKMELMAAIMALRKLHNTTKVHLYTDSQYVRKGITEWITNWQKNGWKNSNKEPVKNKELWLELLEQEKRHDIEWHWVKGHSGDEMNERADALAREAILEIVNA